MKKILGCLVLLCAFAFTMNGAFACEKCNCVCNDGQKCTCECGKNCNCENCNCCKKKLFRFFKKKCNCADTAVKCGCDK